VGKEGRWWEIFRKSEEKGVSNERMSARDQDPKRAGYSSFAIAQATAVAVLRPGEARREPIRLVRAVALVRRDWRKEE
jgi:hypothetical protein